jgi:hypothetical protein
VLPEISKILSNPINIFVLGWLGIYLFFVFFVFFYKFFSLSSWIKKERESLNALLMSGNISGTSSFKRCIEKSANESELAFDACIEAAKTQASGGLTFKYCGVHFSFYRFVRDGYRNFNRFFFNAKRNYY